MSRGNVLNAMAERDGVVPPAAVEPIMDLVGDPARRRSCGCPAERHVRHRPERRQAHDAPSDRLDHRALRRTVRSEGVVMKFRPIAAGDRRAAALLRADPGSRPDVPQGGRRRSGHHGRVGAARWRAHDRRRRGRGRRIGGGRAAARLVEPRRRGAPGVDPAARGQGVGRELARHAVHDAVELGLAKLVVEVIADRPA